MHLGSYSLPSLKLKIDVILNTKKIDSNLIMLVFKELINSAFIRLHGPCSYMNSLHKGKWIKRLHLIIQCPWQTNPSHMEFLFIHLHGATCDFFSSNVACVDITHKGFLFIHLHGATWDLFSSNLACVDIRSHGISFHLLTWCYMWFLFIQSVAACVEITHMRFLFIHSYGATCNFFSSNVVACVDISCLY